MSQFKLHDGEQSPVLILGIDPGTTGTKMAFLKAYEASDGGKLECMADSADKIHMLAGFPGYRQANVSTVPTCLIYRETGDLLKWGHEAVNFQRRHAVDPGYLITNWKLKLLEDSRQGSLETASQRLGKPRGGFATDFFAAVANYLFNEPTSCLLNHFGIDGASIRQFEFIDVVIALPPGWAYEEHSVFSDAAKKALALIPNVRVITASETECALRSWMTQEGRGLHMVDGDVVILLDLGGGTACLSAFYYAEKSQKWVHLESYSLRAGSELVTAQFELDFLKLYEESGLHDKSKAIYKARQEFDLIKMGVGEDDEPEFWDCPVEGLTRSEGTVFHDGQMRFTSRQLKGYFTPFQNLIFAKLDEVVTRLSQNGRKPKYCVLAGAYARNILFLNRFHTTNNSHMRMQVFQPQNLAEMVATGACITRIEGDCRLAFGSRVSVGIMTFLKWRDVKKECPDAHRFLLEGEGRTLWCRVITWVIKKGDDADPDMALIDHDGGLLRRRYIERQDSIIFNETIFTSEAHPGKDQYTVLMYGTDDSGWRNKQVFRKRHGSPLDIHEFKLDLTDKPVIQKDGSEVAMKDSLFKRTHAGKYFEYKYYLNLSQTDCRMSLEALSATGKTRRMLLQYSIPAFEVESAELQDEHRFNEQLSQGVEKNASYSQSKDQGSNVIGTRPMRAGNANQLSSPLSVRSLRTTEDHGPSNTGLDSGSVAKVNNSERFRQNIISNFTPVNSIESLLERRKEHLPTDSPSAMNDTLDSQLDPQNVEIATKAMNVALTAGKSIQEDHRDRDISSTAKATVSRKGVKRTDPSHTEYFPRVTPSSDLWTSRKRGRDFDYATAESEDSDYEPTRKPARKIGTQSLKNPVTKDTRSSRYAQRRLHRLPRSSQSSMGM